MEKTKNNQGKRKEIDREEIEIGDLTTTRKVVCLNCGNYLGKFVGISRHNLVILLCEKCGVLQTCGTIQKIKMKVKDK